jgi:putative chitinase
VTAFNKYADGSSINTPLRQAHFLAQLAHESDSFKTTVEYGGPSKRYAPWYGRGLIQTTWEENYIDFYEWCVKEGYNPPEFFNKSEREQVAKFPWAFLCAIWYWESRDLNELADQDNVRAITKKINGGYNGLEDRIKYLNKAKKILKLKRVDVDAAPGTITTKHKVINIQKALITAGFRVDADGVKGAQTTTAVKMFQKINGLVPDGVIGPKTAEKLFVE